MKKSGSAIFLMEFIVVILFFSLSVTVILQLFMAAHDKVEQSAEISAALLHAQNTAEQIKAIGFDEFTESGWTQVSAPDGTWCFRNVFDDGFTAEVTLEDLGASSFSGFVRVYPPGAEIGGETDTAVCSLALSRYAPQYMKGGL
jgi:hypothetical protein